MKKHILSLLFSFLLILAGTSGAYAQGFARQAADTPDKPVVVTAYPNPASGTFNIDYRLPDTEQRGTIRIINVLGSVVSETQVSSNSGRKSIDVSQLKEGVYLYMVSTQASQSPARKLIIKR